MKNKKIGVVTVTYGSRTVLPDFIDSLRKQTHKEFVLYLVDNKSSDGSVAYYRENSQAIQSVIIENEGNFGVAKGNNQGIQAAMRDGCDYILLINNDTVFPSELFSGLLAAANENEAQVVFPKMLYHDRPDMIWCAGGGFRKDRGLTPVHYGIREPDSEKYSTVIECEYSPTCCALIHADVFKTVGYMDEKYFVYYDDSDFFYRVSLTNMKVIYSGNLKLFHKVSSLTGGEGFSNFSLRYMTRNRVIFLKKHLSKFRLLIWLSHLQLQMLRDFLLKGVTWNGYGIMQKAFFEGLKLKV